MGKRRRKEQPPPPKPDDSAGALAPLASYVPFELGRRGNLLRDETDGVALSREADELFLSRNLIRATKAGAVTASIAPSAVREVRMYRRYVQQSNYHLWHTELVDYAGTKALIASTRDAKKSWDFATNVARLLNVPLAHGKAFHRRIPTTELRQSLWTRADNFPLDADGPDAPKGTELKQLDGAVELAIKDERAVSPVMREWAAFIFAAGFLTTVMTLLAVASRYADGGLMTAAPVFGILFFAFIAHELWKSRPRPKVVTTNVRVTTDGRIIWQEKAGGRQSHNTYDLEQYLDLSVDPPYLVSVEGERQFATQLDPAAMKQLGDWLEKAIAYCRALSTGRRRHTVLAQQKVDKAIPATDVLKADPVPVKID